MIEALITKETQDWATEFRQSVNALEKDLKTKVDQAEAARKAAELEADSKVAREKAARDRAALPGSIEVTVPNADKADKFKLRGELSGVGESLEDELTGTKTWVRVNVPAGLYKLTISATASDQSVANSTVLEVRPGENSKVGISLPIAS